MHTCMHLTMGIIMIHVSVYTHEHIHVFIQGHVGPSLGKKTNNHDLAATAT